MSPEGSGAIHLQARGIGKSFGSTRALDGVTLDIRAGSVHALVGENGAGKSTLGKIIAGTIAPDEGELLLRGEPVAFASPREALARGIALVAQELALVPRLTVAQNVFLGVEPRRAGVIDAARRSARASSASSTSTGFDLPADVAGRRPPPGPPAAGRDPARARPRRGAARARRADRRAVRRRGRAAPRDRPPPRGVGQHRRARLALPARGPRPRGHGDDPARRPPRADGAGRVGDRGQPRGGDARPLARAGLSTEAAAAGRAAHRAARRRASSHRASGTSRSRSAPARSSGSPGLVGAGRSELAHAIFGCEPRDRRAGRGRWRRAGGATPPARCAPASRSSPNRASARA